MKLEVRIRADTLEVGQDAVEELIETALDEENRWWKSHYRFGLTGIERRAVWAFLLRRLLGDERFVGVLGRRGSRPSGPPRP